jgi:hypothetical protein
LYFSKIIEDPRRKEEKNPHIKILPKSRTKYQSLCKFKNPILIQKGILSWLSAQSAQWPNRPSGPIGLAAQSAFFHL